MGGRSCSTHTLFCRAWAPAGSPGLPRSLLSTAQLTVIPCKPESHFPADGAALLYSAQHSHHSPPHHPRRGGVQGAGIFHKQSIWVLLSLERESWETPGRRPHSRFGVSTSPAARGRSLQRLRATLHQASPAAAPRPQCRCPHPSSCPEASAPGQGRRTKASEVALVTTAGEQTHPEGGHCQSATKYRAGDSRPSRPVPSPALPCPRAWAVGTSQPAPELLLHVAAHAAQHSTALPGPGDKPCSPGTVIKPRERVSILTSSTSGTQEPRQVRLRSQRLREHQGLLQPSAGR